MPLTLADARPRFSEAEAVRLAQVHFGLTGTPRPLPSDRDQNVRIETADGRRYVLKIAQSEEDPAVLDAQHAAMQRAFAAGVPVPRLVPSTHGGATVTAAGAGGKTHLVRCVTYLAGTPMATANPKTAALRRHLGHTLGRFTAALEGFDHPGAHRVFPWDLRHARTAVRARRAHLADPACRARIDAVLADFEATTAPLLDALRTSVLHSDANDYNVLVGPPDGAGGRAVTGLIDFGDLVHSWTVGEAAIGASYAMLDQPAPLAAAADVVAGFHEAFPLGEDELAALFGLIRLRLAMSVCTSALQRSQEPENAYLSISERPAWDLLARLAAVPPALAHYTFRHACGLAPVPHAAAVVGWLRDHADALAPVVRPDPQTAPVAVFDFSVGSEQWDTDALTRPGLAEAALFDRIRSAGAETGVGRYDEARLVYGGDQFAGGTLSGAKGERRTIHLGLDLFQPAGSPVFAPLDGVVHSLRDNALAFDYGPTLLLAHHPPGGPAFFTLYGHLSRASLDGLAPGHPITKGAQIATLGTPDENGGWAPHLHLQLITDVLGRQGDFPGVAPASARAVWTSLSPDANLLVGLPESAFPPPAWDAARIRAVRTQHLGPSLSLSYRQPLHIVRGQGAFLYDAEGRAYLDAVNNVPHVGHSHPRVVAAARRQMGTLNTNTRYLHEKVARYAERLAATLPDPLAVCFFTNSGSEANDLALRLAFAHTGRRDVLVLDGGYHGNLTSLIAVSPYKFDGAGGAGQPPHTHVAPMPDPYRGPYRGDGAGARYAEHVRALAEAVPLAAFLHETILSCGGQIVMPDDYLAAAYRHVRAAGGVCIADEVQTGFGRVGSHFWAFETQGVVPDVVVLGKPIGNGHPLGAVVTTPAIAASFANGMEYFNTYGGNPVSCTVGLAVLDVIEDEGLQAHAHRIGTRLLDGLRGLRARHAILGDVRGRGLFVGIELVGDRATRAPAADAAAYVVHRMKAHGILLSTDGPLHNVIKIKPPLAFTAADADRLVATLDGVLAEDFIVHHAS